MQTIHARYQSSWKQLFEDALLEPDPQTFQQRLKAARKVIEDRLLEIDCFGSPNSLEIAELKYARHAVSILQAEAHNLS